MAFKPDWGETIETGHSSDGAWDERKTDEAGHTSFMFVPDGPPTACITAPGFMPAQFDTVMPDEGAKDKGASMFTLFQRFLDGEDVRPQMRQVVE
jgi:hypothetical protein